MRSPQLNCLRIHYCLPQPGSPCEAGAGGHTDCCQIPPRLPGRVRERLAETGGGAPTAASVLGGGAAGARPWGAGFCIRASGRSGTGPLGAGDQRVTQDAVGCAGHPQQFTHHFGLDPAVPVSCLSSRIHRSTSKDSLGRSGRSSGSAPSAFGAGRGAVSYIVRPVQRAGAQWGFSTAGNRGFFFRIQSPREVVADSPGASGLFCSAGRLSVTSPAMSHATGQLKRTVAICHMKSQLGTAVRAR